MKNTETDELIERARFALVDLGLIGDLQPEEIIEEARRYANDMTADDRIRCGLSIWHEDRLIELADSFCN